MDIHFKYNIGDKIKVQNKRYEVIGYNVFKNSIIVICQPINGVFLHYFNINDLI